MKEHAIHIDWSGPYPLAKIRRFSDAERDAGLYQVYGRHPVYGEEALLYIGGCGEALARGIGSDGWARERSDIPTLLFHIGTVRGAQELDAARRSREIQLATKLLVFAHAPAYNGCGIDQVPERQLRHIHLYNWGEFRALLPEVSGTRWTSMYDAMPGFHYICYDSH